LSGFATFTAVRYRPAAAVLGALHLATQRPRLQREPGLRFFRLMGAGAGIGFSARPDPTVWALLCAWDTAADWERFATDSVVIRQYETRGSESYTLLLEPLSAHGAWGGTQPFDVEPGASTGDGEPVVVLTRAALRLRRALRFWGQVASVDGTLRGNPDLLLSFGVGEAPWLLQSTVSVWRSAEAMKAWAYRDGPHREVVRRTRAEGWYREELFARFRLAGTRGTWGGADPLAAHVSASAGTR
jgi:hypothetical protein